MSHVVSASAPIASAHTVKLYPGFGILGADIPTGGESGGSPVINDSPQAASEYHWRIETAPTSGTVTIYPDLTFDHIGAADGTWTWQYRLFEDGVSQGVATVTDTFGSSAISPTTGHATLIGKAPSVAQSDNRIVSPGSGHGAFTGHQSTVIVGANIVVSPAVGHGSFSGYIPVVQQVSGNVIAPSGAQIALTGYVPSILQPIVVNPGSGQLHFYGYGPVVAIVSGQVISPISGHGAFVGYSPQVDRQNSQSVSPVSGHGAFAGYAPTVGTALPSSCPSAADIATAILAAAQITPIHANMKMGNDQTVIGDGSTGNKWRSHLVP